MYVGPGGLACTHDCVRSHACTIITEGSLLPMRLWLGCAILTILVSVQRGMTGLFAEPPPQDAGDVPYDAAWGGTPKAHTNDPTPVTAENNSLGKKGAIGAGESFEEYMKKRAAQGK